MSGRWHALHTDCVFDRRTQANSSAVRAVLKSGRRHDEPALKPRGELLGAARRSSSFFFPILLVKEMLPSLLSRFSFFFIFLEQCARLKSNIVCCPPARLTGPTCPSVGRTAPAKSHLAKQLT